MGDLGHFGVLLFFVHTALVLMMSMERLGLSGRSLYTTFFVRRIFRIYPLSILSVIVVVALHIPPTSWGSYQWAHWPGWPTFLSNIFLIQNITQSISVNCVLWSLPFEIQMYAILPLLFVWALRFPSPRVVYVAWLIGAIIATAEYIVRSGSVDPEFLVFRYFPCFLAGVAAWRLMKVRSPRFPGWAWVLLLFILIALYRSVILLRAHGPVLDGGAGMVRDDHRISWRIYLHFVNDSLFCAAVGLAIPLFREVRSRWLKSISKLVARYSYGIYVSHVPILWFCFTRVHAGSVVASALLAVVLTAAVSVFVFHKIEDPAIGVGKKITTRVVRTRVFAVSGETLEPAP